MLTQEDFHGVLEMFLEWYNKCIAARGDYFEGDKSFMCVLSIKGPIRKKSGNLFNDSRIYYTEQKYLISMKENLSYYTIISLFQQVADVTHLIRWLLTKCKEVQKY